MHLLEKTQNFSFVEIQKTPNTEYNQNNGMREPEINNSICWFTQSHSTECWLNVVTTIFKQYTNTIMLIWYFYTAFSEDVNEDFWCFKKHKNLHFSKSKKHKTQGTYKTTERGNQKYTTQSVDSHSPIQQSADWTSLLQYSNNKVPQ